MSASKNRLLFAIAAVGGNVLLFSGAGSIVCGFLQEEGSDCGSMFPFESLPVAAVIWSAGMAVVAIAVKIRPSKKET